MTDIISIQNLKCNGCAASIIKTLKAFPEVKEVHVDFNDASVHIETDEPERHPAYEQALTAAGYPPVGVENTTGRKVRSYISCAIGRVHAD
ncbi:MAG: heavy metal-associated domain-containing protein [Saprospiraceae bacterium]|nr:heavy metal-associated domain-containing protein [Saprospiraceae bacterium]